MKFLKISKILLISIFPFLVFLLLLHFTIFDGNFYKEKFLEYGIEKEISEPIHLHEKVIDFIKGKNYELPNNFNEREKKHLVDVRNAIRVSLIILYFLIILFVLSLAVSIFILKINNLILNFVGKVLLLGALLTIALATILFFVISTDFSTTFGSFHRLFFEKGTYIFDPAKEIIVKLYPEQLFMDLGIKISKRVLMISIIVALFGLLLLGKSKRIKRKK